MFIKNHVNQFRFVEINYLLRPLTIKHWTAVVGCCSSGLGAKAAVALQPLGLLYTLFSRSSHCRRKMSPRLTRRERSKQREVELNGRERVAENFA
jgi:hypothetical protein